MLSRVLCFTDSRECTDVTVDGQSPPRFAQQTIGLGRFTVAGGYWARATERNSIYCSFVSSLNPLTLMNVDSPPPCLGSISCSPIGLSLLGLVFIVFIIAASFKIIRTNLLGRWPKVWLLLALIALAIFATDCNSSPIGGSETYQLEKRATQVRLLGYTYTNRVLAGTISVSL